MIASLLLLLLVLLLLLLLLCLPILPKWHGDGIITKFMKSVLIIYPHWPPSNLVGVHRVRLIANHLASFGWHPIVLTVHERHYEEPLVPELTALVASTVEVIKVDGLPKPRPDGTDLARRSLDRARGRAHPQPCRGGANARQ